MTPHDASKKVQVFRQVPAILEREKDGLRFEPTSQPGVVRCEACLVVVEPSKINEHQCVDWWNPVIDSKSPPIPEFRAATLLPNHK